MVKVHIEICIISARNLGRSSSLWKPQWFAVGWIDPNNKFCTKIDSSGSPNPTWRTKFSVPIGNASSHLQGLSLTVEVYRREPIFLREKLQGTATIVLKEFFAKFGRDEESRSGVEEIASFQLRKRNSKKPRGFVDVSFRVFEEKEGVYANSGFGEGFGYSDPNTEISVAIENGPVINYPMQPQSSSPSQFGSYNYANYSHINPNQGEGNRRPPTPPPPPPPSNVGFLPSLFPAGTTANRLPDSYINMPVTRPSSNSDGSSFRMGLGAGALTAGAVIFGDDFLSGPTFPTEHDNGGSLTMSTDPLV